MERSFVDKRALVTGAGSGIGKEIAVRLLKSGAKVVALDKSTESLARLKEEHPEIETVEANLTDWYGSKKVIKSILPIDLLVNNAGIATVNSILDVTPEEFDSAYSVNVRAMFNVTQTVVENLYERNVPGAIVNMSSQAAKADLIHRSVNCSSKGAVDAFTRIVAVELGPKNVTINAVNPGTPHFFPTLLNSALFPDIPGLLRRSVYCSSKGAVDAFTRALAVELGPKNVTIHAVNPGTPHFFPTLLNSALFPEIPGLLHRSVYCSSKGAVDAFTKALAVELGPKNVRINAVNPTVVMTDLGRRIWSDPDKRQDMLAKIPLNRFAEVENVADAVLFLLSDQASMIHGHCLAIDGGFLAS